MENPEKTLLDVLQTKWVGSGAIAKTKVIFSLTDWRVVGKLKEKPNIYVKRGRGNYMRREQDVGDLFLFDLRVGVVYWPKGKTVAGFAADKGTHWSMVEEVKKIVQDKNNLPSGWVSMVVRTVASLNPEVVTPPPLIDEVVVETKLSWRPS